MANRIQNKLKFTVKRRISSFPSKSRPFGWKHLASATRKGEASANFTGGPTNPYPVLPRTFQIVSLNSLTYL